MQHGMHIDNCLKQATFLGSDGSVSMANKADMPYTSAFIQELYRYRTLAPLGIPHKANADSGKSFCEK